MAAFPHLICFLFCKNMSMNNKELCKKTGVVLKSITMIDYQKLFRSVKIVSTSEYRNTRKIIKFRMETNSLPKPFCI